VFGCWSVRCQDLMQITICCVIAILTKVLHRKKSEFRNYFQASVTFAIHKKICSTPRQNQARRNLEKRTMNYINQNYWNSWEMWRIALLFYVRCYGDNWPRVSCLSHSLHLKSEAACSSETSIYILRTTRRYIPEDKILHNHSHQNIKSYIRNYSIVYST
jgi:hypothetical protein